ncbi:hypothetical protein GQ602_005566 [Ophiocordyceps camponoti-floridani]|uniref:Uncharacterized protein n=1 Tax=Ophiocordyceps camponoti-floridani TaxID=2030778 RepID=A0A8H4Q3K0_9HYPO|nr:hypothetical protein GQ602_005566 [Ophiocordyceps camponoti-floridani]
MTNTPTGEQSPALFVGTTFLEWPEPLRGRDRRSSPQHQVEAYLHQQHPPARARSPGADLYGVALDGDVNQHHRLRQLRARLVDGCHQVLGGAALHDDGVGCSAKRQD